MRGSAAWGSASNERAMSSAPEIQHGPCREQSGVVSLTTHAAPAQQLQAGCAPPPSVRGRAGAAPCGALRRGCRCERCERRARRARAVKPHVKSACACAVCGRCHRSRRQRCSLATSLRCFAAAQPAGVAWLRPRAVACALCRPRLLASPLCFRSRCSREAARFAAVAVRRARSWSAARPQQSAGSRLAARR